jgi:glycosyltransferase involved in cell wall biosynthesis
MTAEASPIELSVIVPVYNEEQNIGPTYAALTRALEPAFASFEILFVDDGSRDETFPRAEAVARRDPRVRVIKFKRNYGQTPAMAAGIALARGEALVTIDGDLQNDPEDIPQLVRTLHAGYDLVAGIRRRRQDKWLTRKLPSLIANRLIAKVTGVPIKDNGCTLKAYRADVIKRVPLYSEMHRFIPAMASLAGARIAQVEVNHHPRRFGQSKYGLSRTFRVLFDLLSIRTILWFADHPLMVTTLSAGTFLLLSLVCFVIWSLQLGTEPTVVFMGLSLLFGAQAVFFVFRGLLAHLIDQIARARPGNVMGRLLRPAIIA